MSETLPKRRLAVIDGLELYVPADLTDEKIDEQLRELLLDERAIELDALDYATRTRVLASRLEANGWPAGAVEFMRMAAEAVEMIALERKFDGPLVMH